MKIRLYQILIKLQEVYKSCNPDKKDFPNPAKLLNLFKSIVASVSIEVKAPYIGKVVIDGEKLIKTHENLNSKMNTHDIYADYTLYEQELKRLKDFLCSWASQQDKPIVVIIDELDRCRPDYSVKTLEILKHFFDIPGFVFILALDEEQLKNSVKTLFGTENFDEYKRKFINNSFLLPPPDKIKFTDYLYEKSGLTDIVKQIETNEKDLVFKTVIRNLELRLFNGDKSLSAEKTFNKNQTTENIIKR